MDYSLEGKDISFKMYSSTTSVKEGFSVNVMLTASGKDAVNGLVVPYSVIGSIRPGDIKTQKTFGTFTLDESLSDIQTFSINKDEYNEGDQLLTLGLIYKPSVYVDVTVIDTSVVEPDTRDTRYHKVTPDLSLTPLSSKVKEGYTVVCLFKYKGLVPGYKITYTIKDDTLQTVNKSYLITDTSGIAYIVIPTAITNRVNRNIEVIINKYPDIRCSVAVRTARVESYDNPLFSGKRVITEDEVFVLPYGRSVKAYIVGAGGSGGDVALSGGTDGSSGGDTFIYNANYGSYRAQGGAGGKSDGTSAGTVSLISVRDPKDASIVYTVVNSVKGSDTDVYPEQDKQPGGTTRIIDIPSNYIDKRNGSGGVGSVGLMTRQREVIVKRWYGKKKRYMETYQEYVYGRGGNSGAYLSIVITNNSTIDIPLKLVIGKGGVNKGNTSLNGIDGCIILEDA